MTNGVHESEFYMWRAVFAFSLVDNNLTLEEQGLLQSYLRKASFSADQLDTLKHDFDHPQNVEALYKKITRAEDKERFCILARALAWSKGNMERQEAVILKHVSCLGGGADDDVLKSTRDHPHLDHYYQHYAKAGMAGFFKPPPAMQMQA